MRSSQQPNFRKSVKARRPAPPLNGVKLQEMALAYVARFSTSAARLERYLARKLHERGWDDEGERPEPSAIAASFVELGYIDDASYARARSSSLLRRGYGGRRVEQTLWHDGIDAALREELAPDAAAARHAALKLAQKRRFGPFSAEPPDLPQREKQIAAMLRAGHSLDIVRQIVNATSADAALEWAHELDAEEPHDPFI